MKLTNLSLLALSASAINARFVEKHEKDQVVLNSNLQNAEKFRIELGPGEYEWVTEEEKWELRRVCSSNRIVNAQLTVFAARQEFHRRYGDL